MSRMILWGLVVFYDREFQTIRFAMYESIRFVKNQNAPLWNKYSILRLFSFIRFVSKINIFAVLFLACRVSLKCDKCPKKHIGPTI